MSYERTNYFELLKFAVSLSIKTKLKMKILKAFLFSIFYGSSLNDFSFQKKEKEIIFKFQLNGLIQYLQHFILKKMSLLLL
jgi:hypothetical protein